MARPRAQYFHHSLSQGIDLLYPKRIGDGTTPYERRIKMASIRRKFQKLQKDPGLFVKDMILKRIGETGSKSERNSIEIDIGSIEIVDGLTVIDNQKLAASLGRLKDSQAKASISINWRG